MLPVEKQIQVKIEAEKYKKIKLFAYSKGMTVKQVLLEACELIVEEHDIEKAQQ